MRLFRRLLPAFLAATVCFSAVSHGETSKDSPVHEALQDPIQVAVYHGYVANVSGKQTLRIPFCEVKGHIKLDGTYNFCLSSQRPLKLGGHKTAAVKIEPPIDGEWRFTTDYTLEFTPTRFWKANAEYKVKFAADLFPSQVKLQNESIIVHSSPFYLTTKNMSYLQDANDPDKKLVSTQLVFNYPVSQASLTKGLSFTLENSPAAGDGDASAASQAEAPGEKQKFSMVLTEGNVRANVTTPIADLRKNTQFLRMNLDSAIQAMDGSATLAVHPKLTNELSERVLIPSLYDYLKINSVTTQVLKNAHYVPQQMVLIESNTPLLPRDLTKFMEWHLLPKDKVVTGASPKKDYAWTSPAEVTKELRDILPPVGFTPATENGDTPSLINGFNFSNDAKQYILVTIKKGMPARGGYELGADYEAILQVPALPREVKIMAQGALLSLSGEKTLSILSLGVPNIHYKIGRVRQDFINHLISQSRGNFENPQFSSSEFSENNISVFSEETRNLTGTDPKKPDYSSFDFSPYIKNGKGLFFLQLIGKESENAATQTAAQTQNSASKHRYHLHKRNAESDASEPTDQRFILVTDLGLIVKENLDGTRDVFVQSIADGGPVRSAAIEVLGLNGEPIATAKTDGDGHATLPNLDGMKDEKTPVAFVARKGDDLSFLPYERQDRELNYSKFDVSGMKSTEGLQAYLFSDRGIYRPGEAGHISAIVKAKDWTKTVAGLPLVLEIINPHGQVISKQTLELSDEGLLATDFATSEASATGIYNASLYLGRDNNQKGVELGNVSVRVEEFQPDRMKMSSSFLQASHSVEGLAWVKPDALTADISLMQLYGAPAEKRRVTAKLTLSPGQFGFETYKEYSFAAPQNREGTITVPLPETLTDKQGAAHFPLDLTKYKDSTFRMAFMAEGFEPDSGKSVKTAKSVLVSPLDYVLGVKSDGNLDYITPGDTQTISVIAVNALLKKIAAEGVTAEVKKVKTIQSLVKDSSGKYNYQGNTVETPLTAETITVPADGLNYTLPTKDAGDYVLRFKNPQGVELARKDFTVVGQGNAAGDFTRVATMQAAPDKKLYKAGDTISLNIRSPYTGTGLITIETDHVHAWKWFTTSATTSVQTITIPEDFEGKGFINIQFTRDLKSKEIFMSPLSFAVVPFTANIAAHDQNVTINAPKDIKPGEAATVQYHTKKPGKIILYAVDEGILLYGHYKNPDPLDYFLMKRGLEVKTSQIMDLLLPEYSILKSLSQAGGDGFANDGKNLNPFKRKTEPPVAYWSGILPSDAQDRYWSFTVPSYFNGSVRIIAVSVAQDAMGVSEAGMNVHGPLIVTPNLPLFAAPGDVFNTSVTIANHAKNSGKNAHVELRLEPSAQLKLLDFPKAPLAIPEDTEMSVPIKIQAADILGSASLKFTATLGTDNFSIAQTLSVRPPVPSLTTLISGFAKTATATVNQPRKLYNELSDMHAAASSLPVALIGGLKDYLTTYPYGCTEQVTSESFPNVTLYGNSELIHAFGWNSQEMEKALNTSFESLRERQSDSGGWGTWNYYSESHNFISAYVVHFLLEAKEKNLAVPMDVFDNGMRYLKNAVNSEPSSLEDAREKAYGIYLLTRSGEITTNYIPHLTGYLDTYYRDKWHSDLAAMYLAATYQLMQMQPEANALLDRFQLGAPILYTTSWRDYAFYDNLVRYSQYVYLLSRHFPERVATMDKAAVYRIADLVSEGSYNTLSSSYAVMALSAYMNAQKPGLAHLTIHARDENGKEQPLNVAGEQLKVAELKGLIQAVTFNSDTPEFFYQLATSGYDKTLPDKPIAQGLELTRSYQDDAGKPVNAVKLGERVNVVFTLRSGSNDTLQNIAVVDLLPGGFELEPDPVRIAPKVEQDASEENNSSADTTTTDASAGTAPAESGKEEHAADGTSTVKPDLAVPLANWQPQSTDRREDRIILYGTFEPEVETYRYRMKATAKGSFITPPFYAESMYDSTLKTRGLSGTIQVQ